MNIDIKPSIDVSKYEIGCIIGRFQVHKLHSAHIAIIDKVSKHHKKLIIFLGVPVVGNTTYNPLDYASRKEMLQEKYPKAVILPQKDQRSNELWSENLDSQIAIPFGDVSALLYGSRDSFIPYYTGKYTTTELTTDVFFSGREVRKQVSREILASEDFRAGVIHANYAQRPVTYPTVDVVAYNDKGQILLGKKANEKGYRFIGGFVDRTDNNWEHAAKREFSEETGCEIGDLKYVTSSVIDDWRYSKSKSGIMTTLFCGKFIFGSITPSDDIEQLAWVYPKDINIENDIMSEHQDLFSDLIKFLPTQIDIIK